MERAAYLLIKFKELNLTSLSHQVGFSNSSSFSKSFKKLYNQSPTQFRENNKNIISKIGQNNSKIRHSPKQLDDYICKMEEHKNWVQKNANIKVQIIEEKHIASIYHIGDIGFAQKFEKLMTWVLKKKAIRLSDLKMGTIYYDSYKFTEPSKVRKRAFILLHEAVTADEVITPKSIGSGKYLIANIELTIHEFARAWSGLFIWLNENNFKVRDAQPFEIYHNNFNDNAEGKSSVDLYIPIY